MERPFLTDCKINTGKELRNQMNWKPHIWMAVVCRPHFQKHGCRLSSESSRVVSRSLMVLNYNLIIYFFT